MSIKAFDNLVRELSSLPGIGKKSATRIAFHLLKQPDSSLNRLGEVISGIKQKIIPIE